jgi:hypothetical protein
MRMEFDERRLKQMAAVKWRLAPEEWPVNVVPLARAAERVVSGYVTQLKCVVGRTPEEMERILGLRRAELAKGAAVLWLGRLPDWEGVRAARVHSVPRRAAA